MERGGRWWVLEIALDGVSQVGKLIGDLFVGIIMRKVLKMFGLVLSGLLVMKLLAKVLFPDVPDVGGLVVDSLYRSPVVSDKLGQLQSFKFDVDSVSSDKASYLVTIKINGMNSDTLLRAIIIKTDDKWQIKQLSAGGR